MVSCLHCSQPIRSPLDRYCRHCGRMLGHPGLEEQPQELQEIWRDPGDEPLLGLFRLRQVLLGPRESGRLDLWVPGSFRRSAPLSAPPRASCLIDSLYVAVQPHFLEVVPLKPLLDGDSCRQQRGGRLQLPEPLMLAPVVGGEFLAWTGRERLWVYRVGAMGLELAWSKALPDSAVVVAWLGEMLCLTWGQHFLGLAGESGATLQKVSLPGSVALMQASPDPAQGMWLLTHEGELLRYAQSQVQRVCPTALLSGYGMAVGPAQVVLSCGRTLGVLSLDSGRLHRLELPQACVLPGLVGRDWAVLTSYEGMLYLLALDQEMPRVVQARRPFTSFEPTILAPLLAGDRLYLAGPEGQVVGYRVGW